MKVNHKNIYGRSVLNYALNLENPFILKRLLEKFEIESKDKYLEFENSLLIKAAINGKTVLINSFQTTLTTFCKMNIFSI